MANRSVRTRVTEGGRIVLPARLRKALGLEVGDEVLLSLQDGEVRIQTLDQAIRRAQELYRRHIPEDRSLADELIAERRRESERE